MNSKQYKKSAQTCRADLYRLHFYRLILILPADSFKSKITRALKFQSAKIFFSQHAVIIAADVKFHPVSALNFKRHVIIRAARCIMVIAAVSVRNFRSFCHDERIND